jgi:hypothetical protein
LIQQLPDVADVGGASGGYSAAAPNQAEGFFRIRALEDAPPNVEFLTPNRDVEAAPGGAVPMRIRVWDKYGLTSAGLLAGREGTEPETIKSFDPAGRQVGQYEYDFKVDKPYRTGDVIVYRAAAADNRNSPGVGGPQTAWSPSFKIIVRDAANLAADKAKRQQELLARLAEILKLQERCRLDTELCLRQYAALEAIAAGATRVRAGQARIRDGLSEVAEKFQFDTETVLVQRVVAVLARNEAPRAVEQAAALAAIAALEARGPLGAPLARTQDDIIRSLQALLAILPSLSARSGEQQTNSANAPPDMPEKLRELKDKLEEFIAAERKVIQASGDLVGKPVDGFSPQDRGLLKELTAVQDQWEKFLEEGLGDFSKLPQQDFSTAVMLEELASVKSDVTMAKGALEAQAVTVATAFEDNGVENAKTLTANIEKWLPEEPDRKKWEMEDPAAGGTNIEQAELPSKLEDLVGDLLEEEEDIFQEMQDLTAKYATSLDLGAGWDAMDGPISNMNAQGVTGNQLPNDSELAGRSGEGRQGKSSGEYVEDQAVGKGGRRTPTRLTPEPYQEGRVKDLSLEPPGGATGGGKISGAGAEGLEGPVPPPLAEEMGRLAGRQAVIVGKARRFGGAFQPGDYAGFRFQEAVTLMSRVANDLGSFRYRNVLRARSVALGAIQRTATLLGTGIDVSDDGSAGMPKNVRENVTDAMSGNLPAEFRDALEHYYRRLSEQAGKSR